MKKYMHKLPKIINPKTGKFFSTYHEYQEHLVTQKINPDTGQLFSSHTEYQLANIQKRTNPETGQPYTSFQEYQKQRARIRKKDPRVRLFSQTIVNELEDRGQGQQWLSDITGIPKQRISDYINSGILPRTPTQRSIFRAFDLPYNSVDELVEYDTIQKQEQEQTQ